MIMKQWIIIFIFLFALSSIGCKSDDIKANPFIEVQEDTLVCKQTEVNLDIKVNSNTEWKASLPSEAATWCKVSALDDLLHLTLAENTDLEARKTNLTIAGGGVSVSIHIQQLGISPDILVNASRLDLNYTDTVVGVTVVSNIEYSIIIPDTVDWIKLTPETKSMKENTHLFAVSENPKQESRFTTICFAQTEGGNLKKELLVTQEYRNTEYNPSDPEGLGDIFITVKSGYASAYQNGEEIEKSFDGDPSTVYHSPWGGTKFPVTLEYNFEDREKVDYILYKPRSSGDNGLMGKFELWVSEGSNASFTKIGDYDFKESQSPSVINFPEPRKEVHGFRFVVHSGKNNFISCAEMEFYRKGEQVNDLSSIFSDNIYSTLKNDVTQSQINAMENPFFRNIAQSLFDNTYNTDFRVQEFEAYPTIASTANELMTNGYCPYENATGIYFEGGKEAVVIVGDAGGNNISLVVHDFDKDTNEAHYLFPGINSIMIQNGGLGYINYFTDDWKTAQPVKIHIPSGKVNGYFDKNRHSAADWNTLLNNSVCRYFDLKGDFINLAYTVPTLKKYCSDGPDLIRLYDEIVTIEHEVMGLVKYNRRPKNHMFARVVESGLYADGIGAAFAEDVMKELADPVGLRSGNGVWAIAHELGHVNQIRPGLKWVSTTEVTNNVYSACVLYHYAKDKMNLERERVNDGDNNHVLGGRFNSYLNYGIVKGEQWLCQKGQDKMSGYENGGDHFVKLCPLWQLLLYYREAGKGNSWYKPDWYADVAEKVRTTDYSGIDLTSGTDQGNLQLTFMKNVSDVVKEDLSDFFIKAGMLKPIDKELDDYSRAQLTITQQQCDELVRYMSKYPKPASPVIYYLTANSVDAFRNKLAVEGEYNMGVQMKDGYCYIDHSVWKNVAVFETYQGERLTKVAMVGTDSSDLSTTLVRYPQNSTRIEAVAWDGTRTLVYGKRNE